MTALAAFLSSFDEAALIAASNKGVVIRARKDAGAGKVALDEHGDSQARLHMDSDEILLDAKGLSACRCSCPAPGLCRHMVAAILFLREHAAPADEAPPPAGPELPAFTLADVESFARADWPLALALADAPFEILPGASRSLRFPETAETVTFPAGRPLPEALFKGPRSTRQRRVIAAAALILLREAGATLPEYVAEEAARSSASPRLLDLVQAALHQAVSALASGQVTEAGNRLFTIAIAARTESVPRLSGALRGLAERLDEDRLRRAKDRPAAILAALSHAYALTEALRSAPDDPALTGVFSRSFAPAGPHELIYLGAEDWQNASGARGFTSFLFDPKSGHFHRATDARGAGVDMTYSPQAQWRAVLWQAGQPTRLGGQRLSFPDLTVAPDGALSLNQQATPAGPYPLADLCRNAAIQRQWGSLSDWLNTRQGIGLRRLPGEALALIAPLEVTEPEFDPLLQEDLWPWFDETGAVLPLRMAQNAWRIRLAPPALGLAAFSADALPRLIAYWPKDAAAPVSLSDPDQWWRRTGKDDKNAPLQPYAAATPRANDPLSRWFERLLESILLRLGQPNGAWPAGLLDEADTLGIHTLAAGLRHAERGPMTPETALRLGYLAEQTRQLAR